MTKASRSRLVRAGKVPSFEPTHEDVADQVWVFLCQDLAEMVMEQVPGFDGEKVASELLTSIGHKSDAWDKYKQEVKLRLQVMTTPDTPVN